MRLLTQSFLLLLALFLGLNLPDLDHQFTFLVHRSIITHGFIVPLALFLIVYRDDASIPRYFSIGFSLAAVVHLSFDLFPRAWTGFALIHIPTLGRTSPLFSGLWIGVSIIVCFYLTLLLIKHLADIILAAGSLIIAFSFYASTQPILWLPLLTVIIAIGMALAMPTNSRELLRQLFIGGNY